MLDDLDHELEQRGHRFARYADDFVIVVQSKRSAERVMRSISSFIETKLKLIVNREKTKIGRLTQCSFLGFVISPKRIRCLAIKLDTFKKTLRQITCRRWGISMEERLERLRLYVNGWLGYFSIGVPFKDIRSLDQWLRRRVRLCYWKQWRLPRTRYRKLRALGINPKTIKQASRCRKGKRPAICHLGIIENDAILGRWNQLRLSCVSSLRSRTAKGARFAVQMSGRRFWSATIRVA